MLSKYTNKPPNKIEAPANVIAVRYPCSIPATRITIIKLEKIGPPTPPYEVETPAVNTQPNVTIM